MTILRPIIAASLVLVFSAHRLPAPIQEVPESPAPKPTQPVKRAPKKTTQSKPKTTDAATPTPAPQSKATPANAPVSPAEQAAITTTLTELEQKWEQAVARHNTAQVDSLVADDYVSVSSAGKVVSKSALLDQLRNDTNAYDEASVTDLNVRAVRPDFAIIAGLTREKGKGPDGKAFNRAFRFTDTWVKKDGQWRCSNAQVVRVSEK